MSKKEIKTAAEICLNGHLINSWAEKQVGPDPTEFCELDGMGIISHCPECKMYILGHEEGESTYAIINYQTPYYCRFCASPYPWTISASESAKELISCSNLSDSNKENFSNIIPELLSETPKTQVAIFKFKNIHR